MGNKRFLRITIALAFAFQMVSGVVAPVYGGTTGIISGTVTDAQTGEKLAGVNVIVEGTRLTTVTDENGYFVITNVPPGEYTVAVSLVGYTDAQINGLSVVMDVTSAADFALEQAVADEDEVVVAEARPTIQRDVVPTMYIVTSEQEPAVKGQPNTAYQVPGLVITIPGVVADEGGYPHIRGGRVNEVGYMLDGIPITEPIGNGFGTNIVTVGMDKMEIFTGGYRPEYGNAISGVFNQIVKTGRTAPGVNLVTAAGAQAYKSAYPEVGGVLPNGGDYYFGAYLWHSGLESGSANEVDSSDIVGKFNYPISGRDKLTLLTAQGSAKYLFPTTHTQTYEPPDLLTVDSARDFNSQSYLLYALTLNHTMNANSFITLRPYYFRSRKNIDAIKDGFGDIAAGIPYWWQDSESSITGLQLDYTNQVSQKHLIKAGAIRMSGSNSYWVKVPVFDLYGLGEYEYTANTDTVQTGLYIQDQMRLSPRWRVDAGMRHDSMRYDKVVNDDATESQWSPRLGVSYAADPRTNLRFSYGKMIQFVYTQAIERNYTDPDTFWDDIYYGAGTGNLRPERTTQYDLGWERQLNADYSLQVTPFYRKFVDLLQTRLVDPDNPDSSPQVFDNLGEGTTEGVELLLKKHASKSWSGWLTYTWSRAKAESSSDREMITSGVTRYVDWDQRHTAVMVLNYMKNGWTYSLMSEYGSGLPYKLTGEETNSRRVGPHIACNLNISKEVSGGWLPTGTMNLSIANLFNTRKELDRGQDDAPTAKIAPRFISLSYGRRF